jgi:hypothetical protein
MAQQPDEITVEDSEDAAYRVERQDSGEMTSWSRRPDRAIETAEQVHQLTGAPHRVRQVDADAIHAAQPDGEVVHYTGGET